MPTSNGNRGGAKYLLRRARSAGTVRPMSTWLWIAKAIAASFALSAIGAYVHGRAARTERRAGKLPLVRIDEVAAGARVRVEGCAVPRGGDVEAPYSGRTGLAVVSATVDEHQLDRRRELVAPFAVDDGTGVIDVDVAHVSIELPTVEVAAPLPARGFGAKFLSRHEPMRPTWTHVEGVVTAGDRVCVVGTAQRAADGTLALVGTARSPVLITARAS
jgi:hypothetical protein